MSAKERGLKADSGVNNMVKRSLSKKMTFQLRPKGLEEAHQAKNRERTTSGGENSPCKVPEMGKNT